MFCATVQCRKEGKRGMPNVDQLEYAKLSSVDSDIYIPYKSEFKHQRQTSCSEAKGVRTTQNRIVALAVAIELLDGAV
jgi:hypothetical protein